MVSKVRKYDRSSRLVSTAIVTLIGLVFVLPLIWMLSASLQINGDIFKYPFTWLPHAPVSGNVELGQFTAHCRAVTYGCEFLPFPEKVDDMPHCTACVKEYCRAIRNHDCGFLRNQAFFFGSL